MNIPELSEDQFMFILFFVVGVPYFFLFWHFPWGSVIATAGMALYLIGRGIQDV